MSTCEDADGDDNMFGNDTVSSVYCVHWGRTQDFHPQVRGEVGDGVQTVRTSIQRSEGRWAQCTETMDFYLKVKGKMDTQYRDTQDVYLRVRGEVGKCKVTQEIYQQVRGEVGDRVQSLRTSI